MNTVQFNKYLCEIEKETHRLAFEGIGYTITSNTTLKGIEVNGYISISIYHNEECKSFMFIAEHTEPEHFLKMLRSHIDWLLIFE